MYPLISEMTSVLGPIGGATIKFERPPRIVPLYLQSPASSEESSDEENEDEKKEDDGFLTKEVNEERLITLNRDDEGKADHVLTQLDEDEDDKERDPDYVLTQLDEGEDNKEGDLEVVACTPVISNVKQKKGGSSKKKGQSSKKKGIKRKKQGYVLHDKFDIIYYVQY